MKKLHIFSLLLCITAYLIPEGNNLLVCVLVLIALSISIFAELKNTVHQYDDEDTACPPGNHEWIYVKTDPIYNYWECETCNARCKTPKHCG